MFTLTPWRKREATWPAEYPMASMYNEFKPLFERVFANWPMFEMPTETERFWNLEVKETEKEFLVRAEAPGFEAEEFEIKVIGGNHLVLKAEHKYEAEEKKKEYEFAERRELHYERHVTLPAATEPEKVEATYKNGVLDLRLPKTEAAKKFSIPVKK